MEVKGFASAFGVVAVVMDGVSRIHLNDISIVVVIVVVVVIFVNGVIISFNFIVVNICLTFNVQRGLATVRITKTNHLCG
jgi:hypothetical protein